MNKITAAILVLSVVCFCGCGKRGSEPNVQGMVMFHGTPLETGTISFVGKDGSSVEASITSGKYAAKLSPGPKTVRIKSQKVVGTEPRNDYPGDKTLNTTVKSIIPPKYNEQTTLTCTVTNDNKPIDFSLTESF